jgi:menaquinone-dependent protoporphyrinogen oxidase
MMRVLVTAASRHGATSEVAGAIGRTLAKAGLEPDVETPDAIAGIEDYAAVVLGSAVYYGQWLPAAVDFARRNGAALAKRPVWLFSVGPIGSPDLKPVEEPKTPAELVARIGARGHRLFAGALRRHELGLGEKAVASLMHAPEGDFRDWTAIRRWAERIAAEILPGGGASAEV